MRAAPLIKTFFFSNIFYGVCAVALSIETAYQQAIPTANPSFYLLVFFATIAYYTYAYLQEQGVVPQHKNERQEWYTKYQRILPFTQSLLIFASAIITIHLVYEHYDHIQSIPLIHWAILMVLPFLSLFYYGLKIPGKGLLALRNKGLFKPFLIAFIWAASVSLGPVVYHDFVHNTRLLIGPTTAFLFAKNWLFISVLCILFDIKDYATDYNLRLKTFVVRWGLRSTLFKVILPLAFTSWCIFFVLAILGHFPPVRILINAIPFIMLIIVCYSMYQRKTILYYLAIIDGLMLVKAISGITAMILIK